MVILGVGIAGKKTGQHAWVKITHTQHAIVRDHAETPSTFA
jgi:hypothetical protein